MLTAGRMRMARSYSEASMALCSTCGNRVVTTQSNTVTVVQLLREELVPNGKLTQSSHTNMLQWSEANRE